MKERTMNGIPIQEVWRRLQKEFPSTAVKRHPATREEYIPVNKIEERLNEVLGMENWSFVTDRPQICVFGADNHESCVVSGKLILYDDDRIPIIRSTCGGSDIIYPKESTRPTSVANTVDSAVRDVFKRCAKRFGIGWIKRPSSNGENDSGNTQREKQMKVLVLEPFKALPRGGAKVTVSYEGKTMELVFWSVQWEKLRQEYGERFQIGSKINEITCFGVEKQYRGVPQIEFVRLPARGGNR